LERDKRLIITQGLNYGDRQVVDWLKENYTEEEMREVVINPDRGMWWRRILNYWMKILKIKMSARKFNKAIININPS
jgi:hypothetical protein